MIETYLGPINQLCELEGLIAVLEHLRSKGCGDGSLEITGAFIDIQECSFRMMARGQFGTA